MMVLAIEMQASYAIEIQAKCQSGRVIFHVGIVDSSLILITYLHIF